MKVQTIKPRADCPFCHGSGEVNDWVPAPFGSGSVPMPSLCECVDEQCDEDADEVALDTSEANGPVLCPGSGKPGHYVGDGTLGMRYQCAMCSRLYDKAVWWGYAGSSNTNAPEHVAIVSEVNAWKH